MSAFTNALLRPGIAGAAVLGALAFAGPASALPAAHLTPYTEEGYLAVEDGDTSPVTVSCRDASDVPINAYYSIHAVDGGNAADVTRTAMSVTDASGATPASVTQSFAYDDQSPSAEEISTDRAQIKAFLVCLPSSDSEGRALNVPPALRASGTPASVWNFAGWTGTVPADLRTKTFTVGGKTYRRSVGSQAASLPAVSAGGSVAPKSFSEVTVVCPRTAGPVTAYDWFAMSGEATGLNGMSVVGVEPRGGSVAFRLFNTTASAVGSSTPALDAKLVCIRRTTNKAKRSATANGS